MRTLLLALLLPLAALADEINVDLKNPRYKNGMVLTEEGGIVRGQDLRIQARCIEYVKKGDVHHLRACGDLMIQYKGRVYVGSRLEYDFATKKGTVFDGKTFSSMWYVGGDEIELRADGSYSVSNAFFTTCENIDSAWDLHAGQVNVWKDNLLEAKKVRLRVFKIPAFWLPSFKLNLKKFKEPVFRYSINWDKGQGPRAMVRYQFFSWRDWALYGRLEYRLRTGFGGAFETEYLPDDKRTSFVTRSYLGSDRLENAPDKERRYRLQGALNASTESGQTKTVLTWDKYSDVRMPGDFPSEDFEVNTAKRTLFYLYHQEPNAIVSLKVRPRVNAFESIKQDLPTVFATTRSLDLGKTGVLFNFWSKASYLNFIYSNQLAQSLQGFHTPRVELRPLFYRPFHLGSVTFTPRLGAVAIFYGTSPSHEHKTMATALYGAQLFASGQRTYAHTRHTIQPYANYSGLTHPTASPDSHYIFTIQDGYNTLNQLQLGVRQHLTPLHSRSEPTFLADLYTHLFFAERTLITLPRLYLLFGWQLPSLELTFHNCWNFQNQVLDFSNTRLRLTVNENAAFTLDIRYRSRYDWRKADHDNFILDVTRTETELLLSPLSNQRLTLLTHAFFRLTPFWECHFQTHHGFLNRTPDNPYSKQPYNEFKVDLFTWISSAWKLRLSYTHTTKDDRVTAGLSLVKK